MIQNVFLAMSLIGLSTLVHADAILDYPTAYSNCPALQGFKIPKELPDVSVYFNQQCTKAYLISSASGELKISKPQFLEGAKQCPALEANIQHRLGLFDKMGMLVSQLLKSTGVDNDFNAISDQINALQNEITNSGKEFVSVPAVKIPVQFSIGFSDKDLELVREANRDLMTTTNISITPAVLSRNYLSYPAVTPTTNKLTDPAVSEFKIEGEVADVNMSTTTIKFNGNASGYLTLNLQGACPLITGDYNEPASLQLDTTSILSYITVTNTDFIKFDGTSESSSPANERAYTHIFLAK